MNTGSGAPQKWAGDFSLADLRIGIVVSRFNSFITDRLLSGALDALQSAQGTGSDSSAGIPREQIEIVRVPGALELPIAATKLVESRRPDVVICIGCVLRGETSHYDLVCSEVARGVQLAQLDAKTPMIFCVLTCDTLEQAIDRAGLKSGNKGFEAGLAAVEMATLFRKLGASKRESEESAQSPATSADEAGAETREPEVKAGPEGESKEQIAPVMPTGVRARANGKGDGRQGARGAVSRISGRTENRGGGGRR
jgi:6,7-dimethyl-8-ribityllumazine synthase